MFCSECGKALKEGASFCSECGTKAKVFSKEQPEPAVETVPIQNQTTEQPTYDNTQVQPEPQPVRTVSGSVGFGQAIKLFFKNYANFNGRATRSEYWWAFLFNILVSNIASMFQPVGSLVILAFMLPGLSVSIRRLHDTGKSWVYILINLIPLVGAILFIIQLCKKSDEDNQWGAAL